MDMGPRWKVPRYSARHQANSTPTEGAKRVCMAPSVGPILLSALNIFRRLTSQSTVTKFGRGHFRGSFGFRFWTSTQGVKRSCLAASIGSILVLVWTRLVAILPDVPIWWGPFEVECFMDLGPRWKVPNYSARRQANGTRMEGTSTGGAKRSCLAPSVGPILVWFGLSL